MTEAHPLQWPAGKPRSRYQRSSQFGKKSFAQARDFTLTELRRLGARSVVISTNIPIRNDGLPYARFAIPEDKGVAVYFQWDGRQMAFACDQWDKIEHNIYAIGKTIEAMRGIERWGSSDMMKAAFTGFEALPPPSEKKGYAEVLGLSPDDTREDVIRKFKEKYQRATTSDEQRILYAAYQEAKNRRA